MLGLLILAAALLLPSYAGQQAGGASGIQGATGVAPNPHVSTGAVTPTPVNGTVTSAIPCAPVVINRGANCVAAPGCQTIYVGPGNVPTTFQNYVVVSPSTTTTTTSTTVNDTSTTEVTAPQPQVIYVPVPVVVSPPPSTSTAPTSPTPAVAPMPTVVLDAKGFVHSPYSASVFKVPNLTNGQIVHDPSNGQAFRVLLSAPAKTVTLNHFD